MRSPMRGWRLGLMFLCAFASAGSVCAVTRRPNGAVPFPLEAGHPYAGAFAAFNRLTPEERDAVGSAKAGEPPSAAVQEAQRKIASALAQGRDATPQWRAEHDPLLPGYDPVFIKSLSSLAAARLAVAEREGGAGTGDAAALDGLALYLSVGPGLSTEDWSGRQELVVGLLTRLQTRAADRSPAETAALLAELRALPPPTSFADMVRADPLWKAPGTKLRRALERKARAMGFKSDRIDPDVLRMAGVSVEGERAAVSFAMPAGAFWLAPGQDRYGVALLELDVEGRQARILFEGREAVVELKSRRIGLWDDVVLEGAIKGLVEDSDFIVALLLEGGKSGGSLSAHLARLDEFGREVDALTKDIAEGVVGKSDPEALAERAARLHALEPWPDFKGEDFVKGILDAQALGEKTEAEWQKTVSMLEQAAGSAPERR
jgi:hypothetical protein